MKKQYKSPELLVERFELTQHLASCGISLNAIEIACVLNSASATPEMKDLAIQGYFAEGCPRQPVIGPDNYASFCYVTASGLTFGS